MTAIIHDEQTLTADQRAPSTARKSVREVCATCFPHLVDDAVLLVSEVVTNAVKHGQAPVHLCIECGPAGILIEVEDANPELPRARRDDRRRHSGRGLVLVQRLATEWGVRLTGRGKQVWFRLR